MVNRVTRPISGEMALLFSAALRGAIQRPFYWEEFLEQCRFILTANFIPLLLTGMGRA
jgi:hypothetical protein